MALHIHHVFVAATPGCPAVAPLRRHGFAPAAPREHEGQGTANTCLHFANGYLELLWARDAAELASTEVAPTGLADRLAWRDTGASPFGIVLRERGDGPPDAPFPVVPYRAPFAGGRFVFLLADEPVRRGMPLVVILPPDLPDRTEGPDHSCGATTIVRLRLSVAGDPEASPALAWLTREGLCETARAEIPYLELTLGGATAPGTLDLAPDVPVRLVW
jgi:hypothetical protein